MNPLDDALAGINDVLANAKRDQEAREAHLCRSTHVADGELDEGDRIELRLTLKHVLGPFPGNWGDRFGYVFHVDGTCDVVMWWSTGSPGIDEGETADFKMTLKEYAEYQGTPQTVVTRLKIVNEAVERAKRRREEMEEPNED